MSQLGKYVVGIGEILWDLLPGGKAIGGAPANFAYHVSQFGIKSKIISAIGHDSLGEEIINSLKTRGLNGITPKVARPTGTVQVTLDPAGIPQYDITENVAWDNIPLTPEIKLLATETCAVCYGSLAQRNEVSRATINAFLDMIPNGDGRYKIFDINLRQDFYSTEILLNSIAKCNILKINDEEFSKLCELLNMTSRNATECCMRLIKDFKIEILILTCGTTGSYVFTADDTSFIKTPQVDVADTVGAGDSFTAAFTAALLKGKTIQEAHRLAVNVSAHVCTQNGAMPKLPESIRKI